MYVPTTDRSLRSRTRAVIAHEAADRYDSDIESLTKTQYSRKRLDLAPTETEIKRQECSVCISHTDFIGTYVFNYEPYYMFIDSL